MALHKRLKAGDTLYVGDVRIRSTEKTSLIVDADKSMVIIHASTIKEDKGQEAMNMYNKT